MENNCNLSRILCISVNIGMVITLYSVSAIHVLNHGYHDAICIYYIVYVYINISLFFSIWNFKNIFEILFTIESWNILYLKPILVFRVISWIYLLLNICLLMFLEFGPSSLIFIFLKPHPFLLCPVYQVWYILTEMIEMTSSFIYV